MSENDKKEKKREKRARLRGAQVAGAVGDFAGAIAAGLLAEAEQKGSGAGLAAAFAQGVQPIMDFGKIMRGKADPGTVLGKVGQRIMENNQRFASNPEPTTGTEETDTTPPTDPLDAPPTAPSATPATQPTPSDPLSLTTPTSGPEGKPEVITQAEQAVAAASAPQTPLDALPKNVGDDVVNLLLDINISGEEKLRTVNDLVNLVGKEKAEEIVAFIEDNSGRLNLERGRSPFGGSLAPKPKPSAYRTPGQINRAMREDMEERLRRMEQ